MSRSESSDRSQESPAVAGRLARYPSLLTFAAAAGVLALLQGGFQLLVQQSFDKQLALGMARLGLIIGIVTVLLFVPIALLARRWHPSARAGDRGRAFRSLLFGFTVAVGVWMIVRSLASGPLVTAALAPWLAAAVALAAGGWVALRPPSERLTRRAAWLGLAALILALLPWGAPGPPAPPGAEGAEERVSAENLAVARRSDRPLPDVVLVSIDTLRADRLGAYGQVPTLTPEMDRLAEEGLVFERALAASPWTVPSVASMLTGLPTVRHGAGLPLGSGPTFVRSPLSARYASIAERFSAAGYRTHAIVANAFLNPGMGMARGFDAFDMPLNRAVGAIFMADIPLVRLLVTLFPVESWADYRAQGITDAAVAALAQEDDAPLFLWVHYIDPHTPYQADPSELDLDAWAAEVRQRQPEVLDDGTIVGEVFAGTSHVRSGYIWLGPEDRRRLGEYYDRAVSYVDGEVGRLFAALRERREERGVVAALTADHGEELWDHGHFEHGHDYYREVTRVPLIFWGPGVVPAGRAATTLAGLVDVAPTLLDLAGFEVAPAAAPDEGRSLAGSLAVAEPSVMNESRPAADETDEVYDSPAERIVRFSGGNLYGLPAVLLEDDTWRFILRANGVTELYDVAGDPLERRDLSADEPLLVESFRALLEPRLQVFLENAAEDAAALDPETLKALQSLGYVQ